MPVALRVFPLEEAHCPENQMDRVQVPDQSGGEEEEEEEEEEVRRNRGQQQQRGGSGGSGAATTAADSVGGVITPSVITPSSSSGGAHTLLRRVAPGRALREAALLEACEMRCGVDPHANVLQLYGAFKVSCNFHLISN